MARKATKNVGANNHSPETTKPNILKIVPSSCRKNEFVDEIDKDDISFLISRWAKLEDAVKRLEFFAETVGREMLTRQTNLAAFNSTLKKVFPQI
ncbi:MAG: hypothetical protein PHG61_00710 [Candidatus Marinimicrobia bacterium]|nr:hypothetical protein [Candidatus Neomarinimicrobiota bacterium]